MHLILVTGIRAFTILHTSNHSDAIKTSTANFDPDIKILTQSTVKSKGKIESDLFFFSWSTLYKDPKCHYNFTVTGKQMY